VNSNFRSYQAGTSLIVPPYPDANRKIPNPLRSRDPTASSSFFERHRFLSA
jgi:hypothetical protein